MARVHLQVVVVVGGDADEDAGARAREAIGRQATVLERLPDHFQRHALLRIDARRLARRDAEELGIECLHVVDEPAPPRVELARLPRIGVVDLRQIEPVRRDLGDRVGPV